MTTQARTGPLAPRRGGTAPSATVVTLTLVTGAVDTLSFMALGDVFTSVMTANLALLGLSVGSDDLTLTGHVAVALAGYTCGVLLGSRLSAPGKPAQAPQRAALAVETLLFCGFLAGWIAVDGRPAGGAEMGLLATAAVAMGCQSGMVRVVGTPTMSTTYLTGTLTGILAELATKGRLQRANVVLIAVLPVGAVLSAILVTWARVYAPVLPAGLLLGATLLSFVPPGESLPEAHSPAGPAAGSGKVDP
ncbi:YoaK family protein [Streptomyces liangshanensis]|uniref:DUF1275 domain-containing protein n=1 Tax=Streptomyces liangshanensis TaxID=2717324 RepID=A0A6G9H7H6_9ACTN|nr:YoaK family protein [Streptomyces liangshanensis]QIQ06493.1 DUF1275 domain-containing protein [Streptomyces liangshanensis]